MDSSIPPEALKVAPSPTDRVHTPIPVSGARLDPIAGTSVVPRAAVVPAAATIAPRSLVLAAATPVPAASPRAAGLRLPAPPRILADKDKDILEGKKEKLAQEETDC
jgi:hypothetical protein